MREKRMDNRGKRKEWPVEGVSMALTGSLGRSMGSVTPNLCTESALSEGAC
jgi:hypothetical protein